MQTENDSLDALIQKEGQLFDDTKEKLINNLMANEPVFEDETPLPGKNAMVPTADSVTLSKEKAHDNLLMHMAMNKLQKENEEFKKMSDDEKVKDYICQNQYYYETNEFFKKNGYEMSGKQKRFTRRSIENAWKKGKFKVTPEQREDILYELSKASNQKLQTHEEEKPKSNISENIKDLNSLIFRQQ